MTIGRRLGGAPRWMRIYLLLCLAALLIAATIFGLTTVHVSTALARLPRDAAVARPVHGVSYADLINRIANAHDVNPALVAAVVAAESEFNARARSHRGAYGLMQVLPETWRAFSAGKTCAPEVARLTDPPCMEDPAANLEVGTAYLHQLIVRFRGNYPLALAAYNAGAGAIEQHDGVPPFPETTRYLRQVALALFHFQREGTLTPFWGNVIRSVNLWRQALAAALVCLGALTLPLWLAARRPGQAVPHR